MYVIMRSFFYFNNPKTKIVRICFLVFLFSCFFVISWGSFIEPKLIKLKHTELNLEQTTQNENIKIVLLTDLHIGRYKKSFFINRVIKKIQAEKPDLILLGGDYILGKEENFKYLYPLQKLSTTIPTYAITGNHEFALAYDQDPDRQDKTATMRRLFKNWNITILDNKTVKITINKNSFNLTGIPDIWGDDDNLHKAKINLDPRIPSILLCHNPSIIDNPESEIFNLILSGHTHGGQIRLPFWGPVSSLPTTLGRKIDKGLFMIKKTALYISAGLGESGARARLFNQPEISVLNINL